MIPLLLTIIFFSLFGMVHGLRTRELNEIDESKRHDLNRKWHKLQAVMHVIFAVLVAIQFSFWNMIIIFFLVLTIIWICFDLAHNLTTGQRWNYHENSGINGWIKKLLTALLIKISNTKKLFYVISLPTIKEPEKVAQYGVIAVKAILFTSLLILFIL